MKQKTVDKVICFYKFWSATLLAILILWADYRSEAFSIWWISTAIFMIYLLMNIRCLANLKRKISEDRLKELIQERKEMRLVRATRLGSYKEDES